MAAHPKLTKSREQRLLAILRLGEPLEAAARAVDVSTTAIRKRAARDPLFAEQLRAARAEFDRPDPVLLGDWRMVAAQLEAEYPDHWAAPDTRD